MHLSPFHKELAKLVAQGIPNREIMQQVTISASRLSVLKANPLFKREIERCQRIEADKYQKAIKVFADEAENVAKELLHIVKDKLATPPAVRGKIGGEILDRLANASGNVGSKTNNDELVFEQLLRVTKRANGINSEEGELDFDPERAFDELQQDLSLAEDEPIDIIPIKPSFIRSLPTKTPVPSTGDNGRYKYEIPSKLKDLLKH
jgi:hypothetical protein